MDLTIDIEHRSRSTPSSGRSEYISSMKKLCFCGGLLLSIVLCCAFQSKNSGLPTLTLTDSVANIRRKLRAPLLFGVADSKSVEEREEQIGAEFDVIVRYQDVRNMNYKYTVKPYLDLGKEVVVVLEFMTDSYRNLKSIGDGDYDHYLIDFIEMMLDDGNRQIHIRPMHEFNGDWYPWGTYREGDNTTDNFKRAFRHVVQVFRDRGANTTVQLNYNCSNPREDAKPFIDWFPGEEYVDMILCNAYNRTGLTEWHTEWKSLSEVFKDAYDEMSMLPGYKPLGIGETSTTSINSSSKAQWFRDAFRDLVYRFTRVQEVDFFLINKDGRSWDLNSEEEIRAFGESMRKYEWATT